MFRDERTENHVQDISPGMATKMHEIHDKKKSAQSSQEKARTYL
jgi:hypothetical protein